MDRLFFPVVLILFHRFGYLLKKRKAFPHHDSASAMFPSVDDVLIKMIWMVDSLSHTQVCFQRFSSCHCGLRAESMTNSSPVDLSSETVIHQVLLVSLCICLISRVCFFSDEWNFRAKIWYVHFQQSIPQEDIRSDKVRVPNARR